MAWTGSSFVRALGASQWQNDAAANVGIEALIHDTQDNDLATGINNCINKNGANAPTANMPMGGFKHTNVANGTADSDSATFGQTKRPALLETFSVAGGGSAAAAASNRASVAIVSVLIPRAFTATNLAAISVSNLTAGQLDFILYKNGVSTAQSISLAFPANPATNYAAITATAFAAGDLLQIYSVKTTLAYAGTATSICDVFGYFT